MSKISYSYSMVSTYLRCPALFKMLYIDGIKPDEPPSLALHFGTALHCGLNSLLEGGDYSSFGIYWDSVNALNFAKGRHNWEDLRAMGEVFLSRFQKLHQPHYELISGENRLFSTLPSGIRCEGTADALVRYKGKATLMDFKTSATRYGDEKPRSSMQLALYAYLAEKEMGTKIDQVAFTVFIKTKEPTIQVQVMGLSREWLGSMISNFEHICADIEARVHFPKNFDTSMQYGRPCPACLGEKA